MKSRLAILHFKPSTGELIGVSLCEPEMTSEEAQRTCDALAPDDKTKVRNRVAMLVWQETP